MVIRAMNRRYFDAKKSKDVISEEISDKNLSKLKPLSPGDRECIKLAYKIVQSESKKHASNGLQRPLNEEIKENIERKFLEIKEKMNLVPDEKQPSNFAIRTLKGIGTMFDRTSAKSLMNKIHHLNRME